MPDIYTKIEMDSVLTNLSIQYRTPASSAGSFSRL